MLCFSIKYNNIYKKFGKKLYLALFINIKCIIYHSFVLLNTFYLIFFIKLNILVDFFIFLCFFYY